MRWLFIITIRGSVDHFALEIIKPVHNSHFVPVYGPLAILVADIKLLIKFSLNSFFYSISGLQAVLLLRPGNAPLPPDHGFRTIKSLLEL